MFCLVNFFYKFFGHAVDIITNRFLSRVLGEWGESGNHTKGGVPGGGGGGGAGGANLHT